MNKGGARTRTRIWTTAWGLVRQTFAEWWEDRVSRLSASLAYYTAFSIAPLLVIAVRIAAVAFGEKSARNEVTRQLRTLMGEKAADAVGTMLQRASAPGSGGTIATILGGAFFLYAAVSLFGELQDSMNTIWEVKPRPDAGWWPTVRGRLLSFAMVLGTGFLLMVSLVLSAALAAASRYVAGGGEALARAVNAGASLVVFTLVFAMMFKYLPDVKIKWRDVWIGGAATAVLFTLGKYGIGAYLARSGSSIYGAAGAVAILLIWVYYSAQVLFLGAEFTQVYARRHGRGIEPAKDAVPLTDCDRAQRGIPHADQLRAAAAGGGETDRARVPARFRPGHAPAGRAAAVALVCLLLGFLLGRRARRADAKG